MHNIKLTTDKNQYIHDNIKYITSLFKITQNSKEVEIAIYEFENSLSLLTNELNEDNKNLIWNLFKEISKSKFISEDKKQEFKNRSINNYNVEINNKNQIITLSTCDKNNRYRVVVHGIINK